MSQFYNPVRLYFDEDGATRVAEAIRERYAEVRRVLILTRGGEAERSECMLPIMAALASKEVRVIALELANPDISDLLHLHRELFEYDFELVIAVGGGSVLDLAKALTATKGAIWHTEEDVRRTITSEEYRRKMRYTPWIGIPTTSGTGSEVTSWATVWDREKKLKYSISDTMLYAEYAVILPQLTLGIPLRLSVVTALDAMCHAAESYWSVNTNPVTRSYAIQAIERIVGSLPRLREDPSSEKVRRELALASMFAGLAFSNTMTNACHSISYPLTLLYGIEHGIATSITLGGVLKLNQHSILDLDRLLGAFGARKVEDVQRIVFGLYEQYGIATQLRAYGVSMEYVEVLAERAYTKGRMNYNPVALSHMQVQELLTTLL